jgi:hypothetical protein
VGDPYVRKLVNKSFYRAKADMNGTVVVVLDGKLENRALTLIQPISRVFTKGSIIELIGTDDPKAEPGNGVDRISYIGFVEFESGGVVLVGDEVHWNGMVIGTVAGYDDTHMPNHQNTIVAMKQRKSGHELGMRPGDEILIKGFEHNTPTHR